MINKNMIEFLINNYAIFLKMIGFTICLSICLSILYMILAVGTIIISHFVYRVIEVLLIFVFFRKNYKWDYKNYKWDYVDLNFKGYANSVRTTDIKLPPPTPLNNNNKL